MKLNKSSLLIVLAFSAPLVHSATFVIEKLDTGYAIDGNNGANEGQQPYLWPTDTSNENQHWVQISQGDGYYSYKKYGTSLCWDGGEDGDQGQAITLEICDSDNYDQHWSKNKITSGTEIYRIEKRNATGYSVDGNNGADEYQSVYLWDSDDDNENQQWELISVDEDDLIEGVPDRSEWSLSASHNSSALEYAIDDDESTRWDTDTQQDDGQYVIIDLGSQGNFNTITLDTDNSDSDFARTYEVYVSDDGDSWGSAVADGGSASSTTVIEFDDVTAQYIKIVNTGRAQGYWWSIHELYVTSEETLDESSCISVDSLTELASYQDASDTCVIMEPGTYTYDTSNAGTDQEFSDATLLLFSGDNNTFIFDDVKFEYDTDIFTAFGSVEVLQFQVSGENNKFYNLTMEDIGDTTPSDTALAISFDGSDNLIEGFTITTRGSYPYGYGDIFGKSSGSVIGHRKHGGVQFRGTRNHLKDTNLYLRSYGHGIYIQGATDALIEGIYMEGELNTTDEVLSEYGTGSAADEVDFLTIWGYRLQPGWTFSQQEDGIRAYGSGVDFETGEDVDTGNVTVIDSTVKYMRAGVTIGWAGGHKYVQNCKSLAVESGYWVGSNANVVDSSGDSSVGPLYSEDAERSGSTIEVTLLDNEVEKWGDTPTFYLAGSDHDVTIYDGTSDYDDEFEILVAGTRYGHRWLEDSDEEPPHKDADNITLDNQSAYPVALGDNSSESSVTSCGDVTDYGTDNSVENDCGSSTITGSTDCELVTPYNLSVDYINSSSAILYWNDDSENISHYNLRYSSDGGSSWTKEKVVSQQKATQLYGLSSGTSYDWQVRAICDDDSGTNYSDTDSSFTTD